MTYISAEEDELLDEQNKFNTIEKKWKKLISERDRLISEWNLIYEYPIEQVINEKICLERKIRIEELNIEDYQERFDSLNTEIKDLINIRRTSPRAKELFKQKMEAIKAVEKSLSMYSNAGIKFRKARSKFINSLLKKEYF